MSRSAQDPQTGLDSSPIPVYFRLKTQLLESILRGEYGPGDRLPTEHELCRRHGISRTPVGRALSELAEEGVILRHRRRGTFVNPHWAPRPANRAEVRVVVPEGPWGAMIAAAVPDDLSANVVTVARPELHRTLTHAVAEGRAPDLALLDSVWVPELAEAGFLRPLEEIDPRWVRDEHEADVRAPVLAANRHAGRTFGVSVFADVAGLWYRRDALERAGVAPPTSWRELRAAAETVASSRAARHALVMPGGSRAGETTTYCLVALLAANGARVLEDGRVTIGSDRAAGSLRFAVSLIDDGLMPREVVAYEWDRAAHLLGSGQAAMSFGGSYEAHTLARELRVPLDRLFEHVGFAAVPRGPHGAPATATGTMVFGVLRQAAQPKLALRLLRETVAPESVARAALATGRIPARRSAVALAAAGSAFVAETAAMLDHAVARPATPLYGRVSAQLQAMLEAVLDGRRTPAEAARRAAELIGAITGLPVAGEP